VDHAEPIDSETDYCCFALGWGHGKSTRRLSLGQRRQDRHLGDYARVEDDWSSRVAWQQVPEKGLALGQAFDEEASVVLEAEP
jgi:hypothetical protein